MSQDELETLAKRLMKVRWSEVFTDEQVAWCAVARECARFAAKELAKLLVPPDYFVNHPIHSRELIQARIAELRGEETTVEPKAEVPSEICKQYAESMIDDFMRVAKVLLVRPIAPDYKQACKDRADCIDLIASALASLPLSPPDPALVPNVPSREAVAQAIGDVKHPPTRQPFEQNIRELRLAQADAVLALLKPDPAMATVRREDLSYGVRHYGIENAAKSFDRDCPERRLSAAALAPPKPKCEHEHTTRTADWLTCTFCGARTKLEWQPGDANADQK